MIFKRKRQKHIFQGIFFITKNYLQFLYFLAKLLTEEKSNPVIPVVPKVSPKKPKASPVKPSNEYVEFSDDNEVSSEERDVEEVEEVEELEPLPYELDGEGTEGIFLLLILVPKKVTNRKFTRKMFCYVYTLICNLQY